MTADVGKLLGEQKVDAILCVAGGWAGGSAKAKCKLFVSSILTNTLMQWAEKVMVRGRLKSLLYDGHTEREPIAPPKSMGAGTPLSAFHSLFYLMVSCD